MALLPPQVAELATFRGGVFAEGAETEQAEAVLQQATDLVWAFTGIESPPYDPRESRILKNAILDFALWLMAQYEHRDEINSPFSGERIGSYSYQKMQAAQRGEDVGIFWLEMLFKMLLGSDSAWVSSERVFNPEGLDFAQQDERDRSRLPNGGWF